jgi:hypothetical protein
VPDTPGGLAKILRILTDNNINVEYMYGFVEKFSENALLVFRFDNAEKAQQMLKANGVNVIDEHDIEGL